MKTIVALLATVVIAAAAVIQIGASLQYEVAVVDKTVELFGRVEADRQLRDYAAARKEFGAARVAHWRLIGSFLALRACYGKLGATGRYLLEARLPPTKVPPVIVPVGSTPVELGGSTHDRIQAYFGRVSLADHLPEGAAPRLAMLPLAAWTNELKRDQDARERELRKENLTCD